MSQPDRQQRSQRRWYQFSLRTLMIVIAAAAGLAFAWAKTIEPYRLQRRTMDLVAKLGGTYKTEAATGWVRYLANHSQDIVVVDLSGSDDVAAYLPHLTRLPKLRTLVVGGQSFGDKQLMALKQLGTLRGLVLDSTTVSYEGLEGLKERQPDLVVYKSERRAVAELKKLQVTWGFDDGTKPPRIAVPDWLRSEVGDVYFAEFPVVVRLDTSRAKDADLFWLTNLPDVQCVIADKAQVDGSFLTQVVTSSSLTRLSLDGTRITDSTLAHILRFPNLTWLDVSGTEISDEGMAHVATLGQLEHLQLSDTHITDAGIGHIAGLPHLQHFKARHTLLGDKGLAVVAALPSVTALDISNTLVTDDGLTQLALSKTLGALVLSDTSITDKGVPHLEKLTGLGFAYN